ncbi:prorelaxin H2-like isoform X2 [Nycticebus coucang]|uniref:prorelaxin H2-like isoform X2 n=1 Tax=Nycticebus coucang TaxID=9470 RepID=UPI00234CFB65|nr:prorelaxin H2-like isoform X2 [Nycticebus coucang]XP_053429351.1 prorelaxin H2-like isoform X2 [Nycticebus coucang]XP_053429361.1 prorelaxin H2-like isoform X2 [Nycticebus coucang]
MEGVWLLLSQFSRAEMDDEEDMNQIIKACGRQLIRIWVDVCGNSGMSMRSKSQKEHRWGTGPFSEIVPSSFNKDAETVNMMSESIANLPQERKATPSRKNLPLPELQQNLPTLKGSDISFEEVKNNIHNKQHEAEDDSPSELKYLGFRTHSRKKRDVYIPPVKKCCEIGCTKKSLFKFC